MECSRTVSFVTSWVMENIVELMIRDLLWVELFWKSTDSRDFFFYYHNDHTHHYKWHYFEITNFFKRDLSFWIKKVWSEIFVKIRFTVPTRSLFSYA